MSTCCLLTYTITWAPLASEVPASGSVRITVPTGTLSSTVKRCTTESPCSRRVSTAWSWLMLVTSFTCTQRVPRLTFRVTFWPTLTVRGGLGVWL